MGTDRDSTHTIVVKTENRGLRVVIGAFVLYLWLRWWWTGSLFVAVASSVPADVQDGQFGSVTGTLLPIVVDLLGFVGSVVISVGGLGWRAVWDLLSGILETLGLWRKQEAATQAAVDAATQSANISAASDAGAATWPERAPSFKGPVIPTKRRVDLEKVAAALNSQDTELDDLDKLVSELRNGLSLFSKSTTQRINAIETQANATHEALTGFMRETLFRLDALDKCCPGDDVMRDAILRISTIENSLERIGEWQGEMNNKILHKADRIEALEQSTVKKPAPRKVTRQSPAKRSTKAKP